MAQFDESKIINALHPEKAEVGKKYLFGDTLKALKKKVENGIEDGILDHIINASMPFINESGSGYQFLYPYEEPPKQRMTNRQLAEWLAKGNGQYTLGRDDPKTHFEYNIELDDEEVDVGYIVVIRSWGSDKWVSPTVDIYERDCKKE